MNWGLGHATRDIPIIRKFIEDGHKIVVAGTHPVTTLLKNEFPQLTIEELPGFTPFYSKKNTQTVKMLLQSPAFLFSILKEHLQAKHLIHKHKIHTIISDNRYGVWSKKTTNILITHQLHLRSTKKWHFTEKASNLLVKYFASKFSEIWIPDHPGEQSLTGLLTSKFPLPRNSKFIGPLSRFTCSAKPTPKNIYDILFLLSGPEPQRSLLEDIILSQIAHKPYQCLLIRGCIETTTIQHNNPLLEVHNHLDSTDLLEKLFSAKQIVCRSGYSTIMDLNTLGLEAWLIPTPGQTEQEYLAQHLSEKKYFKTLQQQNFSLKEIVGQ